MQPISVTIVVCGWIWYGSPSWSRAWLWSADSLPDEFSIPDSASIPRKDDHDDWTIEYLPKVDSIVTKELFFPTLKCFVSIQHSYLDGVKIKMLSTITGDSLEMTLDVG